MDKNFDANSYLKKYSGNFSWRKEDLLLLDKIDTFEAGVELALSIIKRMPFPDNICMICGPISTPTEKYQENVWNFISAINYFSLENFNRNGFVAFDQMPFESVLARICSKMQYEGYPPVIEEFYQPIFSSKLISYYLFLSNWQESTGAKKEHVFLKSINAPIGYLKLSNIKQLSLTKI